MPLDTSSAQDSASSTVPTAMMAMRQPTRLKRTVHQGSSSKEKPRVLKRTVLSEEYDPSAASSSTQVRPLEEAEEGEYLDDVPDLDDR